MSRILPDYNQLMRFTINDVCNWLAENRFGEFVKQFREHGIDGNRFVTLSDLELSRMNCPMAKRRDLLKLVKELPKPAESSRVKNIVQPQIPSTPSRDYNPPHHGRPPPPIPASQAQVNGENDDDDDGSGPEDDYEWGASDFSDVSSEEDYENTPDSIAPVAEPRRPTQQPPGRRKDKYKYEDTDSVGSYEEPDPQSAPPPSVPTRRGAPQVAPSGPPRSAPHVIPVNRRPVPQMPPEEQQPVYEETNEEDEQPVYEDPDEQPVKKPAPRRQLPVPEQTNTMGRKIPMRTTSEPDAPAPPPPRGKGRQPPKAGKKAEESSAPVPPPPRGVRRPPPEPTQEEFYEDPDNPPQTGRKTSGPQIPPPQDDFEQDTYEDPDAAPTPQHATVRNSALPPLPKGANQKSFVPPVEQQDVYEDPDEAPPQPTPSRTKIAALPPTPKASQQKSPYHGRKTPAAPKQEEFEQLEYEVPEEVLKGQMPQDDYMTMQASPEDTKKKNKKKGHEGVQVFPVQNGGQNASLPPRPGKHKQLPVPPMDTKPASPAEVKRESSGRTKVEKVNKALSLEEQPWYHGEIERNVADNKLLGIGTNGCYLIRKSKKGGETKPYTLAIFYESQVFNLNIRKKPNHQYALGMAKPGEQEFSNLMDLVTFFQGHRLILAKGQTRLKVPCQ
ncbi:basic salivary proline-rich protein 2-like isoform X5 [Mytilus californianus]|uniref:basic salivary proline-rich protein 2-like isoform X5 n=1 Tax=Mytilus californianus TaxID=6549 RepID=UPI002245BC9D|nr:basic salivary proline-rich protein 2-like isoform X5 [Mytilus californianus]